MYNMDIYKENMNYEEDINVQTPTEVVISDSDLLIKA